MIRKNRSKDGGHLPKAPILLIVLVLAFVVYYAYGSKTDLPRVIGVSDMTLGETPMVILQLVVPGAPSDTQIKESEVRKFSDGSEEFVLAYDAKRRAEEIYSYIKDYFSKNNLSVFFDMATPFVSPDKFFVSAKSADGTTYDILVSQNGNMSRVQISSTSAR